MTDDVFKDLCPGPSDSVKVTEQYQLVMQRDGLDDAGELVIKLILVQVWRTFCMLARKQQAQIRVHGGERVWRVVVLTRQISTIPEP